MLKLNLFNLSEIIEDVNPIEAATAEETKGSRMEFPTSIRTTIAEFQTAYRVLFKERISRENVAVILMYYGKESVEGFTHQMKRKIAVIDADAG